MNYRTYPQLYKDLRNKVIVIGAVIIISCLISLIMGRWTIEWNGFAIIGFFLIYSGIREFICFEPKFCKRISISLFFLIITTLILLNM